MSTTSTLPASGTWAIDPVHSNAHFKIKHLKVATFRGSINNVNGSLEDGVLSGSVALDNLELGSTVPVFKDHLHSPDWFDAATHPTLAFRSTDLHTHGEDVHGQGELTIKGTTKPVEFHGSVSGPAEVTRPDGGQDTRLGLDLHTTIDRREFGLEAEGGTSFHVDIEVSLELVQSA